MGIKLLTGLGALILATTVHAQVFVGDSQMEAWRQMRGFGLHLDSVVIEGKVQVYTADSIRIAGLLNHVTIHLNDSQRVEKMIFESRDIDSITFAEKYALILASPELTHRLDDGDNLMIRVEHHADIVEIIYDRRTKHVLTTDSAK